MEFGEFMNAHPTIFHFVDGIQRFLDSRGFISLSERDLGRVERGGKYYLSRNGSNLIAFVVGHDFIPGPDGFAIVGSHIDANRLLLKPSSTSDPTPLGFVRLGAASYGSGGNSSWWDRDLGLGGRVVVRNPRTNAVTSRLVRLPGVVGSIPSLAEHFGSLSTDRNPETREVPLVGLQASVKSSPSGSPDLLYGLTEDEKRSPLAGKHPVALLRAVARELEVSIENMLEWELELFSAEPARIGGLGGEFLYCGRMDDRLCSYAAIRGLVEAQLQAPHTCQVVALYDDEEIGSETRTGARNKLLERVCALVHESLGATVDEAKQSAANSIIVSADVTHAGNPNYIDDAYLAHHVPQLNTGMAVKMLGHFSSDSIGSALCSLVSERAGLPLQCFAPRNDTRSGGTIGNMVAASTGMRTVDVGIPILAMHAIREVTGSKDVALGIRWFRVFFTMADTLLHDVYL